MRKHDVEILEWQLQLYHIDRASLEAIVGTWDIISEPHYEDPQKIALIWHSHQAHTKANEPHSAQAQGFYILGQ